MKKIINHLIIGAVNDESINLFRIKYNVFDYFDFDKIIPIPSTLKEIPEKYLTSDYGTVNYNLWRFDNWGTIKNSSNNVIKQFNNILYIKYETEETTPDKIIEKLRLQNLGEYTVTNLTTQEYLELENDISEREECGLYLQSQRLTYQLIKNIDEEHPVLLVLDKIIKHLEETPLQKVVLETDIDKVLDDVCDDDNKHLIRIIKRELYDKLMFKNDEKVGFI